MLFTPPYALPPFFCRYAAIATYTLPATLDVTLRHIVIDSFFAAMLPLHAELPMPLMRAVLLRRARCRVVMRRDMLGVARGYARDACLMLARAARFVIYACVD